MVLIVRDHMTDILLDEHTIEEILLVIEKNESCKMDVQKEICGVWLQNRETQAELRILTLFQIKVTVSRVFFTNRRCGTMTQIAKILEGFCQNNNIPKLLIQSVGTPAMSNWCFKNGFRPVPGTSFECRGVTLGDFEKVFPIS